MSDGKNFGYLNYRVLVRSVPLADTGDVSESAEIIECYYDDQDRIVAWCAATPMGDDPRGLERDLLKMAQVAGLATLTVDKHRALTLDDLPSEVPA